MTPPDRHRIQRQIVELAIGDGLSAPAVQESFARSFQEEIAPEIESVFDRAAGAHQLLRLDRLEIDLGRIESSDWQPELRRRLGVELAQQLARYQPETAAPRTAFDAGSGEPLRQFLYFLEHGRIPWWGTRPEAGWGGALSGLHLDGYALRGLLQSDAHARLRFIDALDDGQLGQTVAAWCGVQHSARALEGVARGGRKNISRGSWRRGFWSRLIEVALQPGLRRTGRPELRRELPDTTFVPGPHSPGPLSKSARAIRMETRDVEAHSIPDELPSPWREWLALPAAPGDRKGRATAPKQLEEDAIYLPGAGVLLLHPFLEPLFRDRGLLESRDFRDAAARERAVHLVGLLTFGRVDVPEYDLVSAKLLCGHPLDEPIVPVSLDEADVAASEELLAAVLRHWSALRSSSTEWLRTQFFLRDGKLEKVDEGFRLTVERRAQDVLLARLPWGIGVIDFPWMNEKVFTRWLD